MKVGILGSGDVAKALAGGFLKHGHAVMIGTRTSAKLADWNKQNPVGRTGHFADAAQFSEMVVLAVKGTVDAQVLRDAGAMNLAGKLVIDATNPIANDPPTNGVLRFFTTLDESLMERLQREFERVHFVKAFNSVGHARMVNPTYKGGTPTCSSAGMTRRQRRPCAAFWISSVGKRRTWGRSRRPARSSRSACSGAFPDFFATSGCTRLSCWPHDWAKNRTRCAIGPVKIGISFNRLGTLVSRPERSFRAATQPSPGLACGLIPILIPSSDGPVAALVSDLNHNVPSHDSPCESVLMMCFPLGLY